MYDALSQMMDRFQRVGSQDLLFRDDTGTLACCVSPVSWGKGPAQACRMFFSMQMRRAGTTVTAECAPAVYLDEPHLQRTGDQLYKGDRSLLYVNFGDDNREKLRRQRAALSNWWDVSKQSPQGLTPQVVQRLVREVACIPASQDINPLTPSVSVHNGDYPAPPERAVPCDEQAVLKELHQFRLKALPAVYATVLQSARQLLSRNALSGHIQHPSVNRDRQPMNRLTCAHLACQPVTSRRTPTATCVCGSWPQRFTSDCTRSARYFTMRAAQLTSSSSSQRT